MIEISYDPQIFNVQNIEQAKKVILSDTEIQTSDERWIEETEFIVGIIEKYKPKLVVDYGCGIGRVAKNLVDKCTVMGVEISPTMLTLGLQYVNSPKFIVMGPQGLQALVEGGVKADFVLAAWVLQHCFNPLDDINLIKSILTDDGILLVVNTETRGVPVVGSFVDDGFDVWTELNKHFLTIKKEKLPETALRGDWRDKSYYAILNKYKENEMVSWSPHG